MVFVFQPTIETHNLKEKTVIVTGGSAGVGRVSCKVFASLGAHLIIASRNKEKTCQVIDEIKALTGNENIEFLELDLSDLNSVKHAAQKLIDRKLNVSILMNNAGIAAIPGLTKDGFEIQFGEFDVIIPSYFSTGTNHLGPFLFTELLIPLMDKEKGSRIVFLSSKAAGNGKKYSFERDLTNECKDTVKLQPYCNSKLANALYAKKLGQILQGTGITTYSLHPGVVATDIWKTVPWPFQSFIKLFSK
jgi:retinol dehydrogenase-12